MFVEPARTTPEYHLTVRDGITAIWADLLNKEDLSEDADFFALGGDSLVAMRMAARVRKLFGIPVPVRLVFDFPVLADYYACVETLYER